MGRKKGDRTTTQGNPETGMDDLDAILAEVADMEQEATGQAPGTGVAPENIPEEWNDPDLDALSEEIGQAMDADPALRDEEDDEVAGELDAEHDRTVAETEADVQHEARNAWDETGEESDSGGKAHAEAPDHEVSEDLEAMMVDLDDSAEALETTATEVDRLQEEVLPEAESELDALLASAPEESPGHSAPTEGAEVSDEVEDSASTSEGASAADSDSTICEQDSISPSACDTGEDHTEALNHTFDQVRHNLESAIGHLQGVLRQITEVQQETVTRVRQARQFKTAAERALETGRRFSQAHLDAARARSVYEDAQFQAESLRQAWEDAQRAAGEAAGLLS